MTGPTGSGKTTTLYTGLLGLNAVSRKIITVEDPIEYQLAGINQIQVKPQIGLNFASLLRSILRQDPDVIMVGEIRDLETAQIAVQAALTGHLVLSTVHTNSAAATITRLRDMGLEDYLLAAVLRGVLAQRLVRRLCPDCRRPAEAPAALVRRFGLDAADRGAADRAVARGRLSAVPRHRLSRAAGDRGVPAARCGDRTAHFRPRRSGGGGARGDRGRDAHAAGCRAGRGARRHHHDRGGDAQPAHGKRRGSGACGPSGVEGQRPSPSS